MAEERGVRTISFPAISTGVYGYPLKEAAEIAIREVVMHLNSDNKLQAVIFVLFGAQAYLIFAAALNA
jgi:O-acetyl-ADP-ribose deacetylase (regulator of RNase III)